MLHLRIPRIKITPDGITAAVATLVIGRYVLKLLTDTHKLSESEAERARDRLLLNLGLTSFLTWVGLKGYHAAVDHTRKSTALMEISHQELRFWEEYKLKNAYRQWNFYVTQFNTPREIFPDAARILHDLIEFHGSGKSAAWQGQQLLDRWAYLRRNALRIDPNSPCAKGWNEHMLVKEWKPSTDFWGKTKMVETFCSHPEWIAAPFLNQAVIKQGLFGLTVERIDAIKFQKGWWGSLDRGEELDLTTLTLRSLYEMITHGDFVLTIYDVPPANQYIYDKTKENEIKEYRLGYTTNFEIFDRIFEIKHNRDGSAFEFTSKPSSPRFTEMLKNVAVRDSAFYHKMFTTGIVAEDAKPGCRFCGAAIQPICLNCGHPFSQENIENTIDEYNQDNSKQKCPKCKNYINMANLVHGLNHHHLWPQTPPLGRTIRQENLLNQLLNKDDIEKYFKINIKKNNGPWAEWNLVYVCPTHHPQPKHFWPILGDNNSILMSDQEIIITMKDLGPFKNKDYDFKQFWDQFGYLCTFNNYLLWLQYKGLVKLQTQNIVRIKDYEKINDKIILNENEIYLPLF